MKWFQEGSRTEEIRSSRNVIHGPRRRFQTQACLHLLGSLGDLGSGCVCSPFHPPFIQRFTPQRRNRWCPLSRVDVRTRWCTALGLAQHAKLNFNVSEQLNDRGLIRTNSLFTGLKTSKPKRHKQCSTATVAARLPNCMFARSHSA